MGMAATEPQFHVLAVDDSRIDRKLIETLLKTSSYQVTAVDSGSKALEFLGFHEDDESNQNVASVSPNNHQEVEVNLVITDYCMPGMTGYDLLKKIKESSSLRSIPVVIMSSENVPSRINRCLEEGADDFFLKPVRLSDVKRLKPHIMKKKPRDQNREDLEQNHKQPIIQLCQELPKPELQQALPLARREQASKRKAVEEDGIAPDRTKPGFTGLMTAVDLMTADSFCIAVLVIVFFSSWSIYARVGL